jgi:hypothetical protein
MSWIASKSLNILIKFILTYITRETRLTLLDRCIPYTVYEILSLFRFNETLLSTSNLNGWRLLKFHWLNTLIADQPISQIWLGLFMCSHDQQIHVFYEKYHLNPITWDIFLNFDENSWKKWTTKKLCSALANFITSSILISGVGENTAVVCYNFK